MSADCCGKMALMADPFWLNTCWQVAASPDTAALTPHESQQRRTEPDAFGDLFKLSQNEFRHRHSTAFADISESDGNLIATER